MQSGTRIEKAGFRLETKKAKSSAVKKAPFQLKKTIMTSNWTRQSKKLGFPIQLVCRIRASEMLESAAAYSYEYHTPTRVRFIRLVYFEAAEFSIFLFLGSS